MFRFFGALTLFASVVWYGFNRVFTMKKRADSLNLFINMLDELKFEMLKKNLYLKKAFENVGRKHNNVCFLNCSEFIEKYGGQRAFEKALLETKALYCFKIDDLNILVNMSHCLGMLDEETQVKKMEFAACELKKNMNEAKNKYNQCGRMYLNISALFGVFLIIIFL